MAPNYQNSKVYCIRNRKDNDEIVYIGSTVRPLSERMAEHRKHARKTSNYEGKLHALMATVGIDEFHIELVEACPCDAKDGLLAKEGVYIRLHRPKCNDRIAGRSIFTWRDENKTKLAELGKARYLAKKEEIKEQKKAYYQQNKVNAVARMKEYNMVYKEEIAENSKAYHAAHRDEIHARQKANREAKRLAAQETL